MTLAEVAANDTLRQACVSMMREFYNGHNEISPRHIVYALLDVGACR